VRAHTAKVSAHQTASIDPAGTILRWSASSTPSRVPWSPSSGVITPDPMPTWASRASAPLCSRPPSTSTCGRSTGVTP